MPLGYCKVRVNITALVKDGNDSDIAPDEQALSGQLKLVPMVKPGTPLQYDDGGRKKLKVLTALENIEIGPMGDIVNGAVDFVTVPAPDASNTNIAALQWQAIFVNPKYGNKIVAINDIYFWAVAGVDIDLADQVNTAPSSTAVQITRGPRGFGVVDAQIDADELVFYAGPLDDPDAWLEAGRVPAPSGGSVADGGVTTSKLAADAVTSDKIASGAVNGPELGQDAVTASKIANDAVARAKLAEEVRTEIESKLSQTTADTRYAPVSTAVQFFGAWQANTAYPANALITNAGSVYLSTATVPARTTFTPADWLALSSEQVAALVEDGSTPGLYAIPTNSGLTEDPSNPGLYLIGSNAKLTEDPSNPGLYLIGA